MADFETPCALCGGTRFERLFDAPDRLGFSAERFGVIRCRSCGLARTAPDATEAELARYYPDEYWGESSEPDAAWLRRTQREKVAVAERHMPAGGRILDVGCGAGFFLRALGADRWDRWGVEISPRSADAACRFLGSGRVVTGRLADARFGGTRFDLITFWASLEHVTRPADDLRLARTLLADGGRLVVQVPDFGSWQARRFGADWFALDVPRHRHHFDLATLGRMLADCGYAPVAVSHRSETHDGHALKHSFKNRWIGRGAPLGRVRYYAVAPLVPVVDRLTGGATLTVVARVTAPA